MRLDGLLVYVTASLSCQASSPAIYSTSLTMHLNVNSMQLCMSSFLSFHSPTSFHSPNKLQMLSGILYSATEGFLSTVPWSCMDHVQLQ